MPLPLMPKATAVWLVENTTLTFEQIAAFCGLHPLEVKAIADGEVAGGMVGLDPIANGQLTKEEIERAEKDENARLRLLSPATVPEPVARSKGPRYTPVAKRQDRPDAIAWLRQQSSRTVGRPGRQAGRHHQADHRRGARPHPLEHPEHQAAQPGPAWALHPAGA